MSFERTIPIFNITEKFFIEICAILMMAICLTLCYQLVFKEIRIGYGRYATNPKSVFGIIVPANLGVLFATSASFVVPLYALLKRGFDIPMVNLSIVLLFIGHYFQRTFIYGASIRGGKPMSLEMTMGIFILLAFDGYFQGFYHLLESVTYPPFAEHLFSPLSIIGLVMFFWGMFVNVQADTILRNLRKPGETDYKIPRGGMFEYVSGANFFGEIVEWFGFALYTRSLPGLAIAVSSLCNIGPRAWSHHQWYLQKFNDYPKERKALIPFVL